MSTYATYCDTQDFVNNSSINVETATLVGMNTTLAGTGQPSVPGLSFSLSFRLLQ